MRRHASIFGFGGPLFQRRARRSCARVVSPTADSAIPRSRSGGATGSVLAVGLMALSWLLNAGCQAPGAQPQKAAQPKKAKP